MGGKRGRSAWDDSRAGEAENVNPNWFEAGTDRSPDTPPALEPFKKRAL